MTVPSTKQQTSPSDIRFITNYHCKTKQILFFVTGTYFLATPNFLLLFQQNLSLYIREPQTSKINLHPAKFLLPLDSLLIQLHFSVIHQECISAKKVSAKYAPLYNIVVKNPFLMRMARHMPSINSSPVSPLLSFIAYHALVSFYVWAAPFAWLIPDLVIFTFNTQL